MRDKLPEIDVVFDGADEVDAKFNMIKGGGGALLREKIVHSTAKQIVIAGRIQQICYPHSVGQSQLKYTPFAIHIVRKSLKILLWLGRK